MNNRVKEDDKAKRTLKIKANESLTLTKPMSPERTAGIEEVASVWKGLALSKYMLCRESEPRHTATVGSISICRT